MDFAESEIFRRSSDSEGEAEAECAALHIHHAASTGDVQQLVQAVQQDPSMLEQQNAEGLTPLGQAVLSQQMAAVKRLVKMGADINAQDGIGRTCLSIAAYQGWLEGVVFLLRNGARQTICDKSGRHPIHAATYDQDVRTLVTLLQTLSLADINQQDHEQMTALHWAAFHNRPEHLKCLMDKGGNIMAHDVDGKLPLHWAAQNGSADCCRLLLTREEEAAEKMLGAQDHTGKTPLHFAAAAGHSDIIRLLAAHPHCQREAEDPDDRTPLHWAAAMGHVQCVQTLLELGVKVTAEDADGGTPLSYASQSGHKECFKILEKAINTPRDKAEGRKSSNNNSSRKGKTPLGFFKGLFQSSRKDPTMGVPEKPVENTTVDKRKSNGGGTKHSKRTNGASQSSKDAVPNDKVSLPPISRDSSYRVVASGRDTGSSMSSHPPKSGMSSRERIAASETEKEKSHQSRHGESKGSKSNTGASTQSVVLPPLLRGAHERELAAPSASGFQELGPLRGVKLQQPRQLSGRVADRAHDSMLFQKSSTEFWTPPSRAVEADVVHAFTDSPQHGLKGTKRARTKGRRNADEALTVRSEQATTDYTFLDEKSSNQEPTQDAVATIETTTIYHNPLPSPHSHQNLSSTEHTHLHPSSTLPPHLPSSSFPNPKAAPAHSQFRPQRNSKLHTSLSTGNLLGARGGGGGGGSGGGSDGTGSGSVAIPEEQCNVGDPSMDSSEPPTLFVAASSVSIHARKPSIGSRDKRRFDRKKSEITMIDV